MKMTLDKIPIERLRELVGTTRVRSLKTGNIGLLAFVSDEVDNEDYTIDIHWDNGNVSLRFWHFWCCNVELVE